MKLAEQNLFKSKGLRGTDWRSGPASLVRDLAGSSFVVALCKSHLPPV